MSAETIVAIASTPGPSGLGVLRLSGPMSMKAARALFHPADGKPLDEQPARYLSFGRLRLPGGEVLDEGLAVRFEAPASFTGEEVVELHVHGGAYHLARCQEALLEAGAGFEPPLRLARPGEFTERAFLNGKLDLAKAEAVADLIHSGAELQHAVAAAQLAGRLSQACEAMRQDLVEVLASGEAACDFPEEEAQLAGTGVLLEKVRALRATCGGLLAAARGGRLASQGVRVALVGPPNAGKSSLMNALLGRQRVLVDEQPGTTRDFVEAFLELDGMAFALVDTAGLRDASGVEAAGAALSLEQAAQAELVLLVLDASKPLDPGFLGRFLGAGFRDVGVAINFADQPAAWGSQDLERALAGQGSKAKARGYAIVSAKTGLGLEALKASLSAWALSGSALPRAGEVLLTNARHEHAMRRTDADLAHVEQALAEGAGPDLWCVDARSALDALGEITGAVVREDVLREIFGRFCIGK